MGISINDVDSDSALALWSRYAEGPIIMTPYEIIMTITGIVGIALLGIQVGRKR